MKIIQTAEVCTGCGMCAAICPSDAVHMVPDAQGFLYPRVDGERCTDCDLCARKCPVSSRPQMSAHTKFMAGCAKDETILSASSSGAVFPVLAEEIIRRGGIVFGAAFDDGFNVVHTAAETVSELGALYGSKYVQSRLSAECYAEVKTALSAGRWVYFSGMPCQVAGLANYLGREYETLITQDTACHSVPSPMIWENYVSVLEAQHGGKMTTFSFRSKVDGWENYHIYASFDNGGELSQPAVDNAYQRGFLKGLYSRSSCFSCSFKGVDRCSDITLADYWGVKGIQPEIYNRLGTSLILLHNERGRQLLTQCQDRLQLCPASDSAFTFNSAILKPIQKPARYDEFWSGYQHKPFETLVQDCCEPTAEERKRTKREKSVLARIIHRWIR